MSGSEETFRKHGATNANELMLDLRKSVHGLMQDYRLWRQLLHARLVEAGFQRCESDMCFN